MTLAQVEITVNRRRFDIRDGVEPVMTSAQIAALVGVPPANAVVEKEVGRGEFKLLAHDRTIEIVNGMHFLVTRQFVLGG